MPIPPVDFILYFFVFISATVRQQAKDFVNSNQDLQDKVQILLMNITFGTSDHIVDVPVELLTDPARQPDRETDIQIFLSVPGITSTE